MIAFFASTFISDGAYAEECEVSKPNMNDPVGAIGSSGLAGWYGNEKLATLIPQSGQWKDQLSRLSWWWYEGYVAESRTAKKLKITAKHLRSTAEATVYPISDAFRVTDQYAWQSMKTAFDFPEPGCWQIVGKYDQEELVFNLWVE